MGGMHANSVLVNASLVAPRKRSHKQRWVVSTIKISSSPLVCDRVELNQAFVHIETVWDLDNAHHTAVVVVLACTFETNNLIVQCHLLAFRIAGLLPISKAKPHPAVIW